MVCEASLAYSPAPYPLQAPIVLYNVKVNPPSTRLKSLRDLTPASPVLLNLHFRALSPQGSFLHVPALVPLPILFPPTFKVQLKNHLFYEPWLDSLSGIPDHLGSLRIPITFCLAVKVKSLSRLQNTPGEQGLCFMLL